MAASPSSDLSRRVLARLDTLCPLDAPLLLAVSGGGDSMALLHLLKDRPTKLRVATVDHGLRDGSADEAREVARVCQAHGLPHATLRWTGWDGGGNLQESARIARRLLLEAHAGQQGIAHIVTGHTADDQAETVLLRLARGSGVDGLAGIAPVTQHGLTWVRPLLNEQRETLRDYLRAIGVGWAEDPSNDDPRFDRVRARQLADALSDLGLSQDRLIETAAHMARARTVLDDAMTGLAKDAVTMDRGDLVVDPVRFEAAREDTRLRLLSAALNWVSGHAYRPRFAALTGLAGAMEGTLHGCRLYAHRGTVRITRELKAVETIEGSPGAPWDGRWIVNGGDPQMSIRVLGEHGLSQLPRDSVRPLPAASAVSTPAVWRGDQLVAAPLAGFEAGWSAKLAKGRDIFPTGVASD